VKASRHGVAKRSGAVKKLFCVRLERHIPARELLQMLQRLKYTFAAEAVE
jgi:hypothetical protein